MLVVGFLIFNLFLTFYAVNFSNNIFDNRYYHKVDSFGVILRFLVPAIFGFITFLACYFLYIVFFILFAIVSAIFPGGMAWPTSGGRAAGAILVYPIIAFFISFYMIRKKITESI